MNKKMEIDTQLIHVGEPKIEGAIAMPIFQTANYQFADETSYDAIRYTRLNNGPNHLALQEKLAAIEGAEAALVTASGMAAISTTLLALLKPGDHALVQTTLYGGTHSLFTQDFAQLGIAHDWIDSSQPQTWQAKLTDKTRLVYVETMSNPLLQVPAMRDMIEFCKRHSLISVVDNTFASPINFRPAQWGFDLSLHSATKYLNGHSDLIAGAIIGKRNLIEKINHKLIHLGGCLDPHACFLLQRGMKTLGVRVRQQNKTALNVARWLACHAKVRAVNYPGLETNPTYAYAREYLEGFGGMLSFELNTIAAGANQFMKSLRYAVVAASLGGVESLVILPAKSSHLGLSDKEREAAGISATLIRMSIGLEDESDLIADLEQALLKI